MKTNVEENLEALRPKKFIQLLCRVTSEHFSKEAQTLTNKNTVQPKKGNTNEQLLVETLSQVKLAPKLVS